MPRYALSFAPRVDCLEGELLDGQGEALPQPYSPEYAVGRLETFYCLSADGELSPVKWIQPLPEPSWGATVVVGLCALVVLKKIRG